MSAPDTTYLDDCTTDPGVLATDDAILAVNDHHNCPPQCLVLGRALDALESDFTEVIAAGLDSGPTMRSSPTTSGNSPTTYCQ